MLGENLKILRKNSKMSQAELAEKLGITQRIYSDYERNRCEPKLETLIKMAEVFNTSTDFLLVRYSKKGDIENEKNS